MKVIKLSPYTFIVILEPFHRDDYIPPVDITKDYSRWGVRQGDPVTHWDLRTHIENKRIGTRILATGYRQWPVVIERIRGGWSEQMIMPELPVGARIENRVARQLKSRTGMRLRPRGRV